jgi:NAD(P)-dependent dehydrogenase (short-subunit alcohol dehydrogenase family)
MDLTPQSRRQESHAPRQPGVFSSSVVIRDDYFGSDKLVGRIALINGGDGGIGRSVAVHFAREGASVAIMYRDNDRDASETAALIEAEGTEALLIRGDVRNREFCRYAVQRTVQRFGMLDILVNNAVEQILRETQQTVSEEQLEHTLRTNICGYIFMTQAALDHLSDNGCIINTGSLTSFGNNNDRLRSHAATRGAIRAYTYSLARQVIDRGIRVNGVAPGPVWTFHISENRSQDEVSKLGTDTLMKRAAQPCEFGPAYVFLASDDASYMTGQFIHINGGSYMA